MNLTGQQHRGRSAPLPWSLMLAGRRLWFWLACSVVFLVNGILLVVHAQWLLGTLCIVTSLLAGAAAFASVIDTKELAEGPAVEPLDEGEESGDPGE